MAIAGFRYDGKRALIVGGASGMGAATARLVADLGAEVLVLDVADVEFPVRRALKVDLRDQAGVDRVVDELAGPIHALFSCAGVADGTTGIVEINFVAQRHIIERLVAAGAMPAGSAVVMISSLAGLGWGQNLPTLLEFLACPDWASALDWIGDHPQQANYIFTKQAMNAYVARAALPLLQKGIRINAVLPSGTVTPLALAQGDRWLGFAAEYRAAAAVEPLRPDDIAAVLAFLGSAAACGVSGTCLPIDHGHSAAALSNAFADRRIRVLAGLE